MNIRKAGDFIDQLSPYSIFNFPFFLRIADLQEGRFPDRSHLVEMEGALLDEVTRSLAPPQSAR